MPREENLRTLGSIKDQERASPKTGRLPEHTAYHNFAKSQLFILNSEVGRWGVGSEHTQIPKHNWYLTGIPPRIPLSARTVPHIHISPTGINLYRRAPVFRGWWKDLSCFALFVPANPHPLSALQAPKDQSQPERHSQDLPKFLTTLWN